MRCDLVGGERELPYLIRSAASYGADDVLGCASNAVNDGLEGGGLLVGRHVDW